MKEKLSAHSFIELSIMLHILCTQHFVLYPAKQFMYKILVFVKALAGVLRLI